jgi:hypothetical protein
MLDHDHSRGAERLAESPGLFRYRTHSFKIEDVYLIEKVLKLFRVVIPSWRFFDELGDVSRLHYRFGSESSKLGPWILYSEKPARNLGTLFLNPRGNLYLANIGLISGLPETEELIENLVQWEVVQARPGKFFFQFKTDDFISELREFPGR